MIENRQLDVDLSFCPPLSKLSYLSSSAVSVPNDECNSPFLKRLDLSPFKFLKSIEIGNTNMYYTKTFIVYGLLQISSIVIGVNSFTSNPNSYETDLTKSFHIMSCKELKSIDIGQYSFSDYSGEFELKNLPSLQSINIGTVNTAAYNFFFSSFVVQGILSVLVNSL